MVLQKSLTLIQHHPAEGPGVIAHWAADRQIALNVVRADLGQLPPIGSAPLILLGGPHEASAGPAWLAEERRWLEGCLAAGAPVFAICLGSQLLALGLKGQVRRLPETETGWTRVTFIDGNALDVLQWHEDAVDLPPGAQLLASSLECAQQMFALGPRRIGLQFHPEWNAESVRTLNAHFGEESPLPRGEPDIAAFARVSDWLEKILDQWWLDSQQSH